MPIEVINRQRLVNVDRRRVADLAAAVLSEAGFGHATVTVAFVRDRAIRRLNFNYRGKDRPSDVLSFPASEQARRGRTVSDAGRSADHPVAAYLGDVVISADTAAEQARAAGHTLRREFGELVIHGVLHLCGYDHETDSGEMNRMELKLRRKLLRYY